MRRPLFFICLCLIAISALRYLWGGDSREGRGEPPGLSDRENVTVTGEVYQKDNRYLYLKSIVILYTAGDLQQNIPITEYFIVEQQEWERGMEPLIGGTVTLRGVYRTFSHATNPGEFDVADYYHSLRIGGKLTDVEVLKRSAEYSGLREALFLLREYWEERLFLIFPEKEASIMATILLGEKAGLDGDIRELYQRNGIVHILSISGLHITIIGMGLYKLLRRGGAPPWLAAFCGSGVLLLYGVMTGMGISVCRAIGMYLIRMLAELVGRTYDLLTALGVVGVIMVWSNPGYLSHSGFLLSFGSLLGVGVIYPILRTAWERDSVSGYRRYEDRRWLRFCRERMQEWGKGMFESVLAGMSIFLATVPIQLWFYYEIPVYSIILNLLVLPFMGILMITGLIAMAIPGLGIVGTADCVILAWYERLCAFFDRLPFHTWTPGRPKWWQAVLYYLFLFLFLWAVEQNVFSFKIRCGKKQWNRKVLRMVSCLMVISVMIGILTFRWQHGDKVTFLDVGQGDAIVLQTRAGAVYLFDGGSSSRSQVGKYIIEPYLKYCGISHIDAVCVSHPDTDHYSGILELLQNCESWGITIDRLILPAVDWSRTGEQEPFLELLMAAQTAKHPIQEYYVQAGDFWKNGEVTFFCLHPAAVQTISDREERMFQPGDANEASECFYVSFERGSLLLTGDVQGAGEEMLSEELSRRGIDNVTVLKVAHHGSRNSTPAELLDQISPQISIVSCGKNNRYGHPHEELLNRLEETGTVIFSTAEDGAIVVRFTAGEAEVHSFLKKMIGE